MSLLVAPLSPPLCAFLCVCVFAGYLCVSSNRFPLCLCIRQTSTRTDTVSVMRLWSCFFVPIVCASLSSPCGLFFLCVFVFVFLIVFTMLMFVPLCVCVFLFACVFVCVYMLFSMCVCVLSLPADRQTSRQTAYLRAFL